MSKRKTPPKISCPKCDGSGIVQLSSQLWNTLQSLRFLKKASAPELFDVIKSPCTEAVQIGVIREYLTPTAVNNRMTELLRLGLVDRERHGKAWIYWVK